MDGGLSAGSDAASSAGTASGYLTIDLGALRRNYRLLADTAAPARTAAVVKADAYGLGAERVCDALYAQGCRHFFVALFVEALRLRPKLAGDAQLFVLNGLLPGNEITCVQNGIIPVLNSLDQLRRWSQAARTLGRKLPAVLQFDTGMSRLGMLPEEWSELAIRPEALGEVDILFIMSHLASADETENDQNAAQRLEMTRIAETFPGFDVCFANSGGIFLGQVFHGALVRPGIALYGGAPTTGTPNPMEPVVSLDVAVVQTRTVQAGTRIGYGGAHRADREMRLATLAAGYADGLQRSLSGRGAVYYHGIRLPIVGRVSMDSISVDITALPENTLSPGSLVEVIGPHQTLEDLARDAGTISYEILTSLGNRYRRHYR